MPEIILHVGMGKTGTSSIQSWLADNSATLRDKYNLNVLKADTDDSGSTGENACSLVPLEAGMNGDSNRFVQIYHRMDKEKKSEFISGFFDQLRGFLDQGNDVLVSAEAFYSLLLKLRDDFIDALNGIAEDYVVRLAYYVRPQHSALEAAWCQWGFRSGQNPSRYLSNYQNALFYHESYVKLKKALPRIRFQVRPYRNNLLESGSVVTDFARNVLELDDEGLVQNDLWRNTSFPLEVVNLLKAVPNEQLWNSPHDNSKLNMLKDIINSPNYTMERRTRYSRMILQVYCYNVFEEGNRKLIEELEWKIKNLIPFPQNGNVPEKTDLSMLDDLWKTRASRSELEFISRLIKHIYTNEES